MQHKDLCQMHIDTPIGELTLVSSPRGLRRVYFDSLTQDDVAGLTVVPHDPHNEIVKKTAQQLYEYFAGTRYSFDVPLDLVGTHFQIATWRSLAQIAYGETATYGQQAQLVGRPKAVRAVGGANRCNPVPIVLPCHRVIGANGQLTGFAGGLDTKRWLLDHERAHCMGTDVLSESSK